MSKEILIHIQEGERRVAILEDGKLDDFYIEVDRYQSILGNIYKGKIESIVSSINGAFVDIGQEKNGFLYLTDWVSPLVEEDISPSKGLLNRFFRKPEKRKERKENKPTAFTQGQEVLVQVVKEPFGTKGARLTTHVALAGRFVVYMPCDRHSGVSKRIENQEERQRLKDVLSEFGFATTGGFIVRTASLQQNSRLLVRDARFLWTLWQRVKNLADEKKAPALIYKEYDLIWKIVRDFLTESVERLIIDSEEEFIKMRKFVHSLIGRHMVNKIQYYKGDVSLFDSKHVTPELNKIYNRRVYLKSGAYIVVEPTEGLIVVDVNSGKFKTSASPEDAAFMVNMEAAPEIARQLRLRDLGGIIVIDFIDMSKEGHKRKVLEALEGALSKDHAKTEVNKISSLGLVEMTRARTGKTVESIAFTECPYCEGRGQVKID